MTETGNIDLPHFGRVAWVGRPPPLDRTESLFIGYSVRNRRFTKDFFRLAAALAGASFRGLCVAIFDRPYAYNDAASRDGGQPTETDFRRSLKIGDERERMIRRTIGLGNQDRLDLRRWPDLETSNVALLRTEFRVAVENSELFRDGLLRNAITWLRSLGRFDAEEFLEFQIQELPVLSDLYYRQGYLVDLYPGRHFEFFFELEKQKWADELPLASKISLNQRLCFLNVQTGSFE